ncbi:MAG TPA: TonB-dependent receptor [Saprospiraceae bacterium]|nr:TonB-dependent receptor [Saprospiraceae bacterium]MCC6689818.1 TonB-dependent receptor [Saprospiraceae bacterium]HMV24079.1 TonB-dependent receptor [Saprospiraceae bacterium]HMX85071.1 TonB-dependent receptor [Saprospiraceae bacterium]HMZ73027.1 TonB-dependent receptor [Saprospiraceae bacterium]
MKRHFLLINFLLSGIFFLTAQTKYTVSGYVRDSLTGETLIGVNIYQQDQPANGTATNEYGFYSLTLSKAPLNLTISYIGYDKQTIRINSPTNQRLNISLYEGLQISEVVVTAEQKDKNVNSTEMSTITLPVETIKKLPALFGEIDIIKSLQLLPGVQFGGEGNSGFYIRGGGADQNLLLLDEANVYNGGHMLGFFSIFNSDAIKGTTLYKGGMPASYGGRLSSVVDIQMKEGNNKDYGMEGGIGLISSRFTVEGPIKKEKSAFLLSGRRTYLFDLLQPFLQKTNYAGTNYFFYDLNAKFNYRFSDKDRLYISGYFGRDILKFQSNQRDFGFKIPYGNTTATIRWNHLFNDKLFMNLSGIYNDYDFSFGGGQAEFQLNVGSGVRDYNLKIDFDYFPDSRNKVEFGAMSIYHRLTPNIVRATNGEINFMSDLTPKYGLENALYIQDDIKWNPRLSTNIGLRFSSFSHIGPYVSSIDSTVYKDFEHIRTFYAVEPRVSAKYSVSPETSIKASLSGTTQYLHLVSNSTSTLPTDVWVPSSELVEPQRGIQYAAGVFRNFFSNTLETSIELYYKDMNHQIDYGESYIASPADEVEKSFVYGIGKSIGAEFFIHKTTGRLNGWISYTLSKTRRKFDDIAGGSWYPVTHDRTHDLNVVANYKINKKLELGAVFVFATGNTYTPLKNLFVTEQDLNIEYGARNSARIQNYHRMDISLNYDPKPDSRKKFKSTWNFSVYNLYNRKNPAFIYNNIETDVNKGTAKAQAIKVSLFPIIPSITWNFKWNQ